MAKVKEIVFEGDNNSLFKKITLSGKESPMEIVLDETQAMVIVCDGKVMDCVSGGRFQVFDTKKKLFGGVKRTGKEVVDLIFMSKTAKLAIPWGTPRRFDIEYLDTGIITDVGISGEMEIRILEPIKFYREMIGANRNADKEWVRNRLLQRLLDIIEPVTARTLREEKIPFTQIVECRLAIGKALESGVRSILEEYGLELTSFLLRDIFMPNIKQVYSDLIKAEKEQKKLQAEAEERERRAKEAAIEQERKEDKAYARRWEERKLTGSELAAYVALMKQLGIKATLDNIPVVGAQTLPGVNILKTGNNTQQVKNAGEPAGNPKVVPKPLPKKACPNCHVLIPCDAVKCPYCGVAFNNGNNGCTPNNNSVVNVNNPNNAFNQANNNKQNNAFEQKVIKFKQFFGNPDARAMMIKMIPNEQDSNNFLAILENDEELRNFIATNEAVVDQMLRLVETVTNS